MTKFSFIIDPFCPNEAGFLRLQLAACGYLDRGERHDVDHVRKTCGSHSPFLIRVRWYLTCQILISISEKFLGNQLSVFCLDEAIDILSVES